MDKDFSDLLSLFDRYGVRYLVVGGYAVAFYAQPRATKDIDLFLGSDRSNVQAAYKALAEYGAPLAGLQLEDLQDADSVFQIGQPPLRIDILKQLGGVTFEEAWQNRIEAEMDGLRIMYIGRDDLIRNKKTVARLQDLADIEAVEIALKSTKVRPPGSGQ